MSNDLYVPSFHLVSDKKAWLLKRSDGIGASEIDAVLGLHKYTMPNQILDRKLGVKEIFKPDAIKRMQQGTVREEEIINLYREKTGLKVESLSLKDKIYYNPDNPCFFASLDGLVTRSDGTQYIIDAKLSNAYFWKNNDAGYYYGQAQQQLYCMGLSYHEFIVLSPDLESPSPDDLKIVSVPRNDNFIENMIAIGNEFWQEVLKKRSENASKSQ